MPSAGAASIATAASGNLTTDDIVAAMLSMVDSLAQMQQPLAECRDCVLAQPVIAPVHLPHRSIASRDGYAVRAADVAAASLARPVRLIVVGDIAPGEATSDALLAGGAFRVMTGAPLPPGTDAVVRREDLHAPPATAHPGHVDVGAPVTPGQFVALSGSEFTAGAQVLSEGSTLGPAELAVLAALGFSSAPIVPKPRVGIVVTGTELRQGSSHTELATLHASNGVLVRAMVEACGGVVESVRITSDDPDRLAEALLDATAADLVVTTGGTGRGAKDVMAHALREREAGSLWNLKVRGSRPAAFRVLHSAVGDRLVPHLALPGRPVAAIVAFLLFAYPLLRHLSARPRRTASCIAARLAAIPPDFGQAQRFLPVSLRRSGGGWEAVPTGDASLYGLAAAVGAHGFALVGPEFAEAAEGREVQVVIPPWHDRVMHEAP